MEIDGRLANGNSFGEEEPAQRILFQFNGHEEHLAQGHLTTGMLSHPYLSPLLQGLEHSVHSVHSCFSYMIALEL